MGLAGLPSRAAWRHIGARDGFEVVFFGAGPDGYRLDGHTAAVEDGQSWAVHYTVLVDPAWATRSARVTGWSASGERTLEIERTGEAGWLVNSEPVPELTGCRDVDLESSVVTNTVPVHRLDLRIGQAAQAPAVFVRADLSVERLEQTYARAPDEGETQVYEYEAPRFDYRGRLGYDRAGVLLRYPGIAERVL
jgi:uncharacterized protein